VFGTAWLPLKTPDADIVHEGPETRPAGLEDRSPTHEPPALYPVPVKVIIVPAGPEDGFAKRVDRTSNWAVEVSPCDPVNNTV
jgi:hypothetical protein